MLTAIARESLKEYTLRRLEYPFPVEKFILQLYACCEIESVLLHAEQFPGASLRSWISNQQIHVIRILFNIMLVLLIGAGIHHLPHFTLFTHP